MAKARDLGLDGQRTWYVVFMMWCIKYGKDYRTEDFDQVKAIPDAEYQELQKKAIFHILNSGRCASCWEPIDTAPQLCQSDRSEDLALVCPHCKFMYVVTPDFHEADWVDA